MRESNLNSLLREMTGPSRHDGRVNRLGIPLMGDCRTIRVPAVCFGGYTVHGNIRWLPCETRVSRPQG